MTGDTRRSLPAPRSLPLDRARAAAEFSPGLLSLQESPPPPMPLIITRTIVCLVMLLIVWAMVGKLDIVASADGRLVPQGYRKIMQPADAGVVHEILVREGDHVEAGQLLMRMDPGIVDAEVRAIAGELELKRAQLRRIDSELAGKALQLDPGEHGTVLARVAEQQAARIQAYRDALAQEQAVLTRTRYDLQAATETLRKLQESLPVYQRSTKAFLRLGTEGFYSPLAVDEKQRELMERQQDVRVQIATCDSLKATISSIEKRIAQIHSSYRRALHDERADTDAQYRRLLEEHNKITHKAARLLLRAPQRGIIKDVVAHAPGTVVAPGTVLMTLIPVDVPLQAEVHVRNEDAGFVHRGQRVKLKLAAYPFQKYGMLNGKIVHLGPDVQDGPQLAANGGYDPAYAGHAGTDGPGLRYKALLQLDQQSLQVDGGKPLALAAGMQVTAEIHLGQRTVMEYLLSPIQKAWQQAGRER